MATCKIVHFPEDRSICGTSPVARCSVHNMAFDPEIYASWGMCIVGLIEFKVDELDRIKKASHP